MFMHPQHLQQADLYFEQLLTTRIAALTPYAWGVSDLEIDAEALVNGQLHVPRFTGVLQDGLPIQFERGQAEAPAARPVEQFFKTSMKSLEVYLGVPREREGAASYETPERPSDRARYKLSVREVADLAAAENAVPVTFAQRNVRILFGPEPREDFECIKIAELVRDPSGALAVSDAYVPPILRLSASRYITEGLRNALRVMVGKRRELAESRRQRDAAAMEFTGQDVTRYLQLSALNGLIPVINHAMEAGDLPPQTAYLLLCQTVGQLSTFHPTVDPTDLPKFQYTQLYATFSGLFERLQVILQGLSAERCITVELEARRDGVHYAQIKDERFLRCTEYLLAVRAELPEREVADSLPQLSKIANWEEIRTLVKAATPGVPVEVTFRPPPEVPVKPGIVYFKLKSGDAGWKGILTAQTVAVYLPKPFDPGRTRVELLGVPPATANAGAR
jgi:type VI secretion system protein ImpJ